MTKCEKCQCDFDELEMVILPMGPEDELTFYCKECYDIVIQDLKEES